MDHLSPTAVCAALTLQAVQLLPEHQVLPGQELCTTATHDTYAISFDLEQSSAPAAEAASGRKPQPTGSSSKSSTGSPASCGDTTAEGQGKAELVPPAGSQPVPTGVPLYDAAWKAGYDRLMQSQAQLARAIAQDPLEHRRVFAAALQVAMRAGEGGGGSGMCGIDADPHHAAALLARLMG